MFSLCRLITLGSFVIVPEAEERTMMCVNYSLVGRGDGRTDGGRKQRDRLYTTGLVWEISTYEYSQRLCNFETILIFLKMITLRVGHARKIHRPRSWHLHSLDFGLGPKFLVGESNVKKPWPCRSYYPAWVPPSQPLPFCFF